MFHIEVIVLDIEKPLILEHLFIASTMFHVHEASARWRIYGNGEEIRWIDNVRYDMAIEEEVYQDETI